MSEDVNVRWGFLKFMYAYAGISVAGFGLIILIIPDQFSSLLGAPSFEPVVWGICGSVWTGLGLLCFLGLRDPLKFLPLLLFQVVYKSIWYLAVWLPLLIMGQFPAWGLLTVLLFWTYIVGNIIAIPWSYLFKKSSD